MMKETTKARRPDRNPDTLVGVTIGDAHFRKRTILTHPT